MAALDDVTYFNVSIFYEPDFSNMTPVITSRDENDEKGEKVEKDEKVVPTGGVKMPCMTNGSTSSDLDEKFSLRRIVEFTISV